MSFHLRLPVSVAEWGKTLIGVVVGGAATAGTSALSIATARGLGIDVPLLNFKALGIVMLNAGVFSGLAFLAKSPLPSSKVEHTEVTITKDVSVSDTDNDPETK